LVVVMTMAATPDVLPSDLTLEIGDDLTPERFLAAARAFFGYVNEIASAVAAPGEMPSWIVRVREGSTLLGVEPSAGTPPDVVQSIYSKVEDGIRWLGNREVEQSGLPENAIKHLRALSELTEGSSGHLTQVRVWVRRRPVDIDAVIAEAVREDWRADYKDFGTIEGRLESIQDRSGKLQLQIRDAALRQTIRCNFPETMLDDAFRCFRKRVEISGTIHYRRNGVPISIEVAGIERLPEDDELPSPDEVRGILRAIV